MCRRLLRRRALRTLCVCAFVVPLCACGRPQPEAPARPPNVVLILADDLGWSDLAVQGSGFYETPHLDRLAADGVRFTAAYANAPNCAPSRASLLTGLYPPRHGVYTVGDPWRGPRPSRRLAPAENRTVLDLEHITLAEELGTAGYATAHAGKWHLGAPGAAGPTAQGFDVNVAGTHAGHPPTYFSPYRIATLPDGPDGEYLTDRMTAEATAFIEQHVAERPRTPFFLYLSYFAVHTPIEAPQAAAARYADREPWHGQQDATYAAMVEALDRGVGGVRATLERLGIADNTVVIFFSDNGGLGGYASAGLPGSDRVTDNHPLKGGKGQLYEGGIRVPLLIAGPGVQAGRVVDEPVIGIDLFSTVLDLADRKPRRDVDGASLLPLLRGSGSLEREALYWHFPAYLQAYGRDGVRTAPAAAIRRGDHKLIWFFENDRVELYDLVADPGERNDLAAARPDEAEALREHLKVWLVATGAAMPQPNPAFAE